MEPFSAMQFYKFLISVQLFLKIHQNKSNISIVCKFFFLAETDAKSRHIEEIW